MPPNIEYFSLGKKPIVSEKVPPQTGYVYQALTGKLPEKSQ
ncbi:MAG TPA: hypothetical protein VK211_26460 [Kamptonema sp.]|nr:hypothetical protein [Kamptonema sp.]